MRFGVCGLEDMSISYVVYNIYTVFVDESIHAEKNNPKLRGRGTHIPARMLTAHIHQKTLSHSFTQPLSHYSTSCTRAHTFTFNYMNSDALMQEGTHRHPAACIQVFLGVRVRACESSVSKNNT